MVPSSVTFITLHKFLKPHCKKIMLSFLLFRAPFFRFSSLHQSPPVSAIFLPVSIFVSVSCIEWREEDIFTVVTLCLIALKESIEHSGSRSYGKRGNLFPRILCRLFLFYLLSVSPPRKYTSHSCISRLLWFYIA